MSESGVQPRRKQIWKFVLALAVTGVVLIGALLWYTTTASFQRMVRQRLTDEIDRITGGHAELGSFHSQPLQFEVEVRDLTVHGREPGGDVPYAHVDSMTARMKWLSLLGGELEFSSVVLDHPVVHIAFYPDGTTNLPERRYAQASGKEAIAQLFSLSINRLDVRHGELLWNDQTVPLDFVANDISADMSYSLRHGSYEGKLLLGKVSSRFHDFRPLAWTAETHFTLSPQGIDVRSLRATSGRSHVEANGRLIDFRSPRIEGTYEVVLDLAEASAITRNPGIARGIVNAKGQGRWTTQDFFSAGKIEARELDWNGEPIVLHRAMASADFSLTPKRIALSEISGRVLNGTTTGNAEIVNWQSAGRPVKGGVLSTAEEQVASLKLSFKDLAVTETLMAIFSHHRSLESLHLAGTAAGTFNAQWTDSIKKLEAETAVDVIPKGAVSGGELPVGGHLTAGYQAATQEWRIFNLIANTRASQVHAAGVFSPHSVLNLSVNSTDLNEWQPVLRVFGSKRQIPALLHGRVWFTGKATGKVSDLTLAGNLQAQDFESLSRQPASRGSTLPQQKIHWDALSANIQFSQYRFAAHDGVLKRGSTSVGFELDTSLSRGEFSSDGQFTASLDVRGADVAETLHLAGYDYPITGTGDILLHASGSWTNPAGDGHVHLTNAQFGGRTFQHFDSGFRFEGKQMFFKDIDLRQDSGIVTGDGSYNFETHAFTSNLIGSNFDLTHVGLNQNKVLVEGQLGFVSHVSGTLQAPTIDGQVNIKNLTLNHERVGDFVLDGATNGEELHLRGQSHFEGSELSLNGNIHLRGDWPGRINAHFNQLDIDSLLHTFLRGGVTGHSAVAGDMRLEGPLLRPRELTATGDLTDLYADIENIKVRNDGPVRFAVSADSLGVEQFHLIGEGTNLTAAGTVQFSGDKALDLHAQGQLNLQLIESFNPSFTSSGTVAVDLAASGTVVNPAIQGRVQITNGAIANINLPSALSDINGSLVFSQNHLQIETLTAHTGGGLVTFGGQATIYNRQLNFDLSAKGQGVRVRYPPGVSSTADADLHFSGSSSASTLSGDVTITKLGVTPGFDFGAYLARSAQASSLPQTDPVLNRIRLDLHIVTVPELQMQTAALRLSGDADLHLRGSLGKPVLLGRADVIEGEAYFNGTKYRLERGDVTFTSPVSTTPVLDLQASTHVRDYDITLNLNGEVDKPSVTYRSEPPLPTADIIALLAFGQTTAESAQLQQSGQSAFTQQASSAILTEALNATINNRVQRLFGVSRIKIDPQGLATETTPIHTGPAVTIEQQVKDNLTITYSTNVSQTSQQIIQAEYNVTRNVSIVGIRDQNGVVSLSVRVRRRKR